MVKILVCGDVEGRYAETFKRVAKLDKKAGPFDALFCVGAFYGDDKSVPAAPIPTYILDGEAGEVAENVTSLGACGATTIEERKGGAGAKHLSVAFVADEGSTKPLEDACATAGFMGVDVLLSNDWPRGVDVGVADAEVEKLAECGVRVNAAGTDRIAECAKMCRPRYHFAGTRNAFWARAPYRHAPKPPSTRKTHVCRFVALGKAALSKDPQRKWIHAVDIDPVPYAPLSTLTDEPVNCGDSPYLCFQSSERPVEKLAKRPVEDTDRGAFRWASVGGAQPKRRKVEEDSSTTLFVGGLPRNCDDSALEDVARKADAKPSAARCVAGKGYGFLDFSSRSDAEAALTSLQNADIKLGGRSLTFDWGTSSAKPKQQHYPDDARRDCWFCLASPGCETHLVTGVGDTCYTCLPKGGLVDAHALIVPIAHASDRASLDDATLNELESTSDQLAKSFREKLNSHAVAFERVADTKKGVYHIHRNIIPLPKRGSGDASRLVADFMDAAQRMSFRLVPVNDGVFRPAPSERFFVVDVYCGDTGSKKRFACVQPKDASQRFAGLHFGRDLLAAALGTPGRAHWKACEVGRSDEERLVAAFKAKVLGEGGS